MTRIRASKVSSDNFASLIREYIGSARFKEYSPATQEAWRRELTYAEDPSRLGSVLLSEIRPALVQGFLDTLSERPGKRANTYTALKQLEKWAVVRDKLPRQIMLGVEVDQPDGGHLPWEPEHVELALTYARETMQKAVTLALHTGQRGSDLVRMRWSHIEVDGGRPGIKVTQKKTGKELWIPFTKGLIAATSTWKKRLPDYLLLRTSGRPWTRHALTQAWTEERRSNPRLKPLDKLELTLHGLRATCCVTLVRSGCTSRQVSDMIGMSEQMVVRYTRFSSQRKNAHAALDFLDRV